MISDNIYEANMVLVCFDPMLTTKLSKHLPEIDSYGKHLIKIIKIILYLCKQIPFSITDMNLQQKKNQCLLCT